MSPLAVAVLLAGLSPGGKTPPTKEIKIGLITPLSGDVKTFGESVKNAFEIAVEEANAKGGVAGRKITTFIVDDKNDPTEASPAVLYDASTDYSKGIAEVFRDAFLRMGGKVVAYESYGKDDVDFSALLTKVRASGADVLFLPDYYNKVGLIAKHSM